jgi:curved DNA-binding protein CbpA
MTKYNRDEFNNVIMELHNNDSFNPFLVLNISTTYTEEELKKQYKYYALKTHPDKGGDPEHFSLVSKSYIYLLKALKHNLPIKSIKEMKEEFDEYVVDQNLNQKQNIKLKEQFDLERFNNVFSEYRINSETDRGYSDFLKEESVQQPVNNTDIFSEGFNLSLFNKIFNTKGVEKNNRQLMKIDVPQEMQDNNGYELGVSDISDFSKGYNINDRGLEYTDVKVAYTTEKLVDESQVEMPEWKNLEHLQRERGNISYELSDRNKLLMENQKQQNEQLEMDRLNTLKMNDYESQKQFNKIHKLMIRN